MRNRTSALAITVAIPSEVDAGPQPITADLKRPDGRWEKRRVHVARQGEWPVAFWLCGRAWIADEEVEDGTM